MPGGTGGIPVKPQVIIDTIGSLDEAKSKLQEILDSEECEDCTDSEEEE